MTLLVVSGLAKSFGAVRAVAGIDFSVAAGEVVALIGPNGAGKSTCFNLIGGQIAPDDGRILFEGGDIAGRPPEALARLGIGRTFQIAGGFPSMSVRENAQMALLAAAGAWASPFGAAAGRQADQAQAVLDEVGIAALGDRLCGELAYGDIKRVELAAAIAARPRLLLMDEPTAGMGVDERAQLMALVVRLARQRGMGVLFTEHDIDLVMKEADRVLVMQAGRLVAEGAPETVTADPAARAAYLSPNKAVPRDGRSV